ncbi:hypothetical protein [Paenibacillus endoradicis]|uniref:hypothetical protein n=1 Tax=Paenibacillus endoradicis TaxID=2972487 RepID=UPI002158C5DB|nr:hypothetical protein [Paenibacillus endoradicis]MCR8659685.1 hypothetical protein [Paenibacillus endoradicis]
MNKSNEKIINQKKKQKLSYKVNHSKKIMFFPTMNDLLALCFLINENKELTARSR